LCWGLLAALAGCALLPPNSFLDPTKVGRFGFDYHEVGLRRVLTPRETPPGLPNATDPTPEDLVPTYEEYRIGVGDQVGIVIDDLIYQGTPYQAIQEVSPTGYVRIPLLGLIKVVGMTEGELEKELENRVREAKLVPEPVVQVVVQVKRNEFFSIAGDVGVSGQYAIPQRDFRLLEALILARDVGANVRTIYVIRRSPEKAAALPPPPGPEVPPPPVPPGELIIPPPAEDEPAAMQAATLRSRARGPQDQPTRPVDPQEREAMDEVIAPAAEQATRPAPQESEPRRPFAPLIFEPETRQPVEAPARPAPPAPAEAPPSPAETAPFEWEEVPEYELSQRVIRIDVDALRRGDPQQNIVIRNRDVIWSPVDVGVFYLMGEVNRPGVFAMGNREITIKQAVGAIGGGFSPFAWPQRCEIIRRERGTDKQYTIPVNLDAVFAGLEKDIVLRDDDVVNVGTHTLAPFLFVIRNSFRFTYGFGFVYDRNFADKDSYSVRTNPEVREDLRRQQRGLPF
jgi:protein involved in polysaccharide export with SLBB domain